MPSLLSGNRPRAQSLKFSLSLYNSQMFITVIILILAQACGKHGPKKNLLFSDLISHDIARQGYDTFWKVDGNMWTTVVSRYPVKKNAITKVTFFMLCGGAFFIGCGPKTKVQWNQHVGQIGETVAYFTENGQKFKYGDPVDFSTPSYAGDNVTMIIDTREDYDSVSFERNKMPLGVAYSGLSEWGDMYIMFSIHWAGHRIKIADYQVIEQSQL